jgi:hypothetical protein
MNNFINEYSAKCLLGPQSKNIQVINNCFFWKVGKKQHVTFLNTILENDLVELRKFPELSIHYVSEDNFNILKSNFDVDKDKNISIGYLVDSDFLKLPGVKFKKIRNNINRCEKLNLTIESNFRNISDVEKLIFTWRDTLADKYFRDFSGKNLFFYRNNFHVNCENIFVYDVDRLISFGTLSPIVDGNCSYVIGKALAKNYIGISEFTDMQIYKRVFNKVGEFKINLGQATKGLIFYKSKFPNSKEKIHYNGKIKIR